MNQPSRTPKPLTTREQLHEIIFEADTPGGKTFDVVLLWLILLSVLTVLVESVSSVRAQYGLELRAIEWLFTLLFTGEYVLRLYSVRQPGRYAAIFFGVVDLLAILPTYLSLVVAGTQVAAGDPGPAVVARLPRAETRQISRGSQLPAGRAARQPRQDHGFLGNDHGDRFDRSRAHVPHRRRGNRLYQHPDRRPIGRLSR